eukprot:834870-Amphidinium_carterae.1
MSAMPSCAGSMAVVMEIMKPHTATWYMSMKQNDMLLQIGPNDNQNCSAESANLLITRKTAKAIAFAKAARKSQPVCRT